MEYKSYLQKNTPVPTATRRRWGWKHGDHKKRKHYKSWLRTETRQDSDCKSKNEDGSRNSIETPNCSAMDSYVESEGENSTNVDRSGQSLETSLFSTMDSDVESEGEDSSRSGHNKSLETSLFSSVDTEFESESEDGSRSGHNKSLETPSFSAMVGAVETNEEQDSWKKAPSKIYPSAKLNEDESVLAILCYVLRHTTTKVAIGDLLELINLHCPEGANGVPLSLYQFMKPFAESSSLETVYICPNCKHCFGDNIPTVCASCDAAPGDIKTLIKCGSVFIKLSIQKQIEEKLRDATFVEALNYKWTRPKSSSHAISDIYDGTLYKAIDALNDPESMNLSLAWNVDGVPVFKSAPFHIWPLQVTINELPPEMRGKHVLLGGLWFGEKRPAMNSFLQPFVDECSHLENDGFSVHCSGKEVHVHVFNLLCVCDSVARCNVQNITQFNGEYGCNWCYTKGEVVEKGSGFTRIYASTQEMELRDHTKHFQDAAQAVSSGMYVRGVKGPSPLMFLTFFNMIASFAFDYMHATLLGVMRQLVTLWFDSKYHEESWYLGKELGNVNKRLLSIKPPVNITRPPRSISIRKYWKASEFRHFLLFYSLPCLSGILSQPYLEHLLLLVQATYLLLNADLTLDDVNNAEVLLFTFVDRFERLYGKCHVSYNVHILLHAASSVRNWGPLWCQSAFVFEGHNGTLQKLFHGTQAVPDQIINTFCLYQKIPRLTSVVYNSNYHPLTKSFVDRMLRGYRLAKNCNIKEDVIFLGYPLVRLPTPRETFLIQSMGLTSKQKCAFYARAIIRGHKVHAKTSKTLSRRLNHAIVTKQGLVALIRSFVDIGQAFRVGYAFIDPVTCGSCHIVKDHETGVTASGLVKELAISHNVQLIKCSDIKTTCVYLKDIPGVNGNFFCIQPNQWEVD